MVSQLTNQPRPDGFQVVCPVRGHLGHRLLPAVLGREEGGARELLLELGDVAENREASEDLSRIKEVQTPYVPKYVTQHGWYNYTIKVPSKFRNELIKFLEKKNIETRLSFPPVHIQPFYKNKFKYKKNFVPVAYKTYSEFLDLPIWANLSRKKITIIINHILTFFK